MKKLLILSTGGTIDKVYFDAKSQYEVGKPVVNEIVDDMNIAFEVKSIEICRKDSLEIDINDRQKLKETIDRSNISTVLVTHGTDTMIDTALFLGEYTDKVIVFTGAMQPAAFKETDGIFNIGTAIGILSCATPGVYIAMNGRAFSPQHVIKNYEAGTFEEIS